MLSDTAPDLTSINYPLSVKLGEQGILDVRAVLDSLCCQLQLRDPRLKEQFVSDFEEVFVDAPKDLATIIFPADVILEWLNRNNF